MVTMNAIDVVTFDRAIPLEREPYDTEHAYAYHIAEAASFGPF